MRRVVVLLLGGLLPLAGAVAGTAPLLHLQVRGDVARAGAVAADPGTRLAQVVTGVGLRPDAYPLGAAYLTPARVAPQRELKAGLVFDLTVLAEVARLRGDAALAHRAERWGDWVKGLPVTGRRTNLVLDPRRLELAHVNPKVQDGDVVTYPARPHTVRVVGAVHAPCTRDFVPMQAARAYLAGCARSPGADPDWLVVIEPDGHVTRRGIGPWNRQPPIPVAPGAVLYVPLGAAALDAMHDTHFNRDMARFLATQPLPEAAP